MVSYAAIPDPPEPDKPRINLSRKKRGPAKKHIPKKEMELRALTPKMRDLAEGRLKVEDLDWEELLQGRLKDSTGKFSGAAPAVLPRSFHTAIAQEIIIRAESKFRENFDDAMKALIGLVNNEKTPARERLAAAQYVLERVIGKIPEKQEIKSEVTVFDQLVNSGGLLIDLGENKDDDIVDAERPEGNPDVG
ncbi:hypothetical protein SEA_WOLLYPOG_80 [Arthrobacter phage Wollypog]|uniref:Uncharacterized protein n=1 Tax=Arthrobacter phage Wollypog TaxID=2790985 RepID=A0A7T3N3J5_9CAUD|nr:terminase small subunit [Arthrobacter phage Wollypog]QPX62629.1 hypothetical protein SEA_WOLLYPOG_80 [Arthrobacter phage Wollypog]